MRTEPSGKQARISDCAAHGLRRTWRECLRTYVGATLHFGDGWAWLMPSISAKCCWVKLARRAKLVERHVCEHLASAAPATAGARFRRHLCFEFPEVPCFRHSWYSFSSLRCSGRRVESASGTKICCTSGYCWSHLRRSTASHCALGIEGVEYAIRTAFVLNAQFANMAECLARMDALKCLGKRRRYALLLGEC